jgi:hypothetical protein
LARNASPTTARGPLVVGEDLMAFEIGDIVSVRTFRDAIRAN